MSEVYVHSYLNELGELVPAHETQRVREVRYTHHTPEQLRQIAVDYMCRMARVKWTCKDRIDYSFNNELLVYEPGQTYVGMIYNNCRNGLENFCEALNENGVYSLEDIGWDTAPGNSCATSIKHAWQLISPDVDYTYSIDMMPYYKETTILPVGDINWDLYDGKNTTESIVKNTDKNVLMEAYAMALPGEGFERYLDTGGHALMVTMDPIVVRNEDGTINPEESYVFLTDQNNRINNFRDYPSSWKLDFKTSFEKCYTCGWLPVTIKQLREGGAEVPDYELTGVPTTQSLEAGVGLKGSVKCNYCVVTLCAQIHKDCAHGDVVQEAQIHPYKKEVSLELLSDKLDWNALGEGDYHLTLNVTVGLESRILFDVAFKK